MPGRERGACLPRRWGMSQQHVESGGRASASSQGRLGALHVLAASSLGAGVAIYAALRHDTPRALAWVDRAAGRGSLARWRAPFAPLARALPEWALYSLPDGLWACSLAAVLAWIWRDGGARAAGWSAGLAAGLGLAIEALQWVDWLPGHADGLDVWFYLVGAAIPSLFTRRQQGRDPAMCKRSQVKSESNSMVRGGTRRVLAPRAR